MIFWCVLVCVCACARAWCTFHHFSNLQLKYPTTSLKVDNIEFQIRIEVLSHLVNFYNITVVVVVKTANQKNYYAYYNETGIYYCHCQLSQIAANKTISYHVYTPSPSHSIRIQGASFIEIGQCNSLFRARADRGHYSHAYGGKFKYIQKNKVQKRPVKGRIWEFSRKSISDWPF